MKYQVIVQKEAEKFLKKLDKGVRKQIIDKLKKLSLNPKLGKPLVGKLAGLWSLRINKFRAVYTIKGNELVVLVLKIGHRKNVY